MRKNASSYEDLDVYQKLCRLHLEVCEISFMFPSFELNETGYELRRASNAAPANIAEGYSRRHSKFYLERLACALGNIRQTRHYLNIAYKKTYIDKSIYSELSVQYAECEKLLKDLEKLVSSWKPKKNTFTKHQYPSNYQ